MRTKSGNRRNRHHMQPKARGGKNVPQNMLLFSEQRHALLHKVFGNLTWYEIILVLIRIARAKHYEDIEPQVKHLYKFLKGGKQ